MAAVSAQQVTLDGQKVVERTRPPKNGFALVLYYAPQDTDWEQLSEWYQRLNAEGLV